MKTKILILSIILTGFIVSGLSDARVSAKSKSVKPGRIDNINLPQIKTLTANNGLRVFYINDELPRVIIVISVGYGKLYETSANAGISDLLADTLSLAGSKKYPADVLNNTIERIGGVFSVQTSYEETQIVLEVIEKHADLAFDILRDIVLNPNLDAKYIEKARSLLLEDVRRKSDDPATLAFDKAKEIIFNGNGYGAYPTEKSLSSITAADLNSILSNYFTAKNIIIGIAGPKSTIDIKENLKGFDALKEGTVMNYGKDPNSLIISLPEKSKNIYLFPKDIPQATIVVGTVAPTIKDADLYSLSLMNDILGGSDFNSRLMQEIRVKRGLAYSVQSVIRARKNTGVFLAFAQTRFESADTALSLMLDNIKQISAKQVNNDELRLAKEAVKNSYIFEFDTPAAILKKYLFLSYNDLPESFLFNYVNRMGKVSKAEIQKSSQDIFSKGIVKLVVGKKELEKSLSKFGKVVIIE